MASFVNHVLAQVQRWTAAAQAAEASDAVLLERYVHQRDLPTQIALVAFSPDDRMLAWTCYKDNVIRLLEVASGRERLRLPGHRGRITSLALSADGRRLLSGCDDTTALVWELDSERSPQSATPSPRK